MKIRENCLTTNDFMSLHKDNKRKIFSDVILKKAFKKNLYDIVIYENDEAIGMGRVLGDGLTVFFIKDIIVREDYRGRGFADIIMKNIMNYIYKNAEKNAYIGLMSTPGKENFYKKFGFIERPNDDYGSGMVMFNE